MLWKIGKVFGGLVALAGAIVGALQIPQIHDLVWAPKASEVQRVVRTLKLSLADSHRAHDKLVTIISDVNYCRYWPHDQAEKVLTVADRRDIGAQRLSKVAQTDDSDAKGLLDAYALVLDTSRTTDVAYAIWLKSWDKRFKEFQAKMQPHQLCPIEAKSGRLWKDFKDDDNAAREAKLSFLSLYDKPAKKYHARIWGAKQI